jgi:serine/threonine protein kinase
VTVSRTGELDETVASDSDAGHSVTSPAATTPTVQLPATISRFAIASRLGEGGMGIVLLATDPLLGRKVALKILRDPAGGDVEDRHARFLREARAMAKLSHENVIVVHEVGTHDGQVYVAMEYVAGTTLSRWQRDKGWREVLAVYERAGRGLAAAHDVGFVHRDFKPDNVLIGDDGRVRVTDFGLVAAVGDEPPRASTPPDMIASSLTHTGALLGTPRFMAPEQHDGAPVDARADQFAFCVALYEALYRQPPFSGTTYAELAQSVIAGELQPAPASEVPGAVHDAIVRGLSRQRADRFASMRELLAILKTAAEPPPRARGRGRLLVVAAAAAIAIGIAVGVVYKLRSDASKADARATELEATVMDLKLKLDTKPPPTEDPTSKPGPSTRSTGQRHAQIEFDTAQTAYTEGRFEEAAAGFLAAYEYWRMPQMIFNAAAAHTMRFKREHAPAEARAAIALYRRYLAETPEAEDRATVERQIAALETELAKQP